jgi:hypothetical protein
VFFDDDFLSFGLCLRAEHFGFQNFQILFDQ